MEVGVVHKVKFVLPGLQNPIEVNHITLLMALISSAALALGAFFLGRKLTERPGRRQSALELVVGGFYNIVEEALGSSAPTYFPLIITIFLYVTLSNWLGLIPGFMSPTEDLNVCVALALIVFCVAHGSGVRKKGLLGYFKDYLQPFPFMLPLNIIGELGQTLSHCFRLFGNIFGGGIIFALVPFVTFKILASFGLPDVSEASFSDMDWSALLTYCSFSPIIVGLFVVVYAFFGLFAGTIQALVFTMLAMTYIGVQVENET